MKKLSALLILIIAASLQLTARAPRLSFGLEWGYTGTFLKTWQYNYIYSSGSRIIENDHLWRYFSNGTVMGCAGLDLSEKVNVSAYSGLLGVYARRWMVPVELRARWCPRGLQEDGPIMHVGAAATFPTSTLYETSARVSAGGGYRFKVYKSISLDFLASFTLCGDHEPIVDSDTQEYVPTMNITTNLAEYWGINFAVALNF